MLSSVSFCRGFCLFLFFVACGTTNFSERHRRSNSFSDVPSCLVKLQNDKPIGAEKKRKKFLQLRPSENRTDTPLGVSSISSETTRPRSTHCFHRTSESPSIPSQVCGETPHFRGNTINILKTPRSSNRERSLLPSRGRRWSSSVAHSCEASPFRCVCMSSHSAERLHDGR